MLNIFKKNRKEYVLKKCGCVCYCPLCRDILNDQADCEDNVEDGLVYYKCNTCNTNSVWTFDIYPFPKFLRIS
jgi:hypothetical protein